ncbi:MAG: SUMF1/EgtB/PvdO family nonheme iron enzyme, partial [Phycisphaerales bacterium]
GVRELAVVPMLLQVIAILWRDRENLPEGRAELYRAAVNYLLVHRDRPKKIQAPLPATKAVSVLRPVSFWMQNELHSDEAEKAKMHKEMRPILDTMKEKVGPEAFCEYLRDRAGLIADYGKDSYIFRHKSFREYLAGRELVTRAERDADSFEQVVGQFGKDWWNEPLRFFMGEVDDTLFDQFMDALFKSDASKELDQKSYDLLLTMVGEAPQRRIDALVRRLNDANSAENQRRYIVDCLKTIGNEAALQAIEQFAEKEGETVAGGFAKSYVAEARAEVIPAAAAAIAEDAFEALPQSLLNPWEFNAEYIRIPPGTFKYSVTKQNEPVANLYFAKYPVTNKRYRRFISYLAGGEKDLSEILPVKLFSERMLGFAANVKDFESYLGRDGGKCAEKLKSRHDEEKRFKGDDQPVVGVSWFDANAYCLWLTSLEAATRGVAVEKLGHSYRLPKEVEWEWAASGGKREYPWPPEKGGPNDKLANYDSDVGATTPVGRYPEGATPEGLMDMAGNVWEWMENWHEKHVGKYRSLRGGSWVDDAGCLRCSFRVDCYPVLRVSRLGFRVVFSQS